MSEPRILYHGSPVIIEDIALASGTWFTDDKEIALFYGQVIYHVDLSKLPEGVITGPNWEGHYVSRRAIPWACTTCERVAPSVDDRCTTQCMRGNVAECVCHPPVEDVD